LYDAKLNLSGGNKAGRIVFEGYSQSSFAARWFTTDWTSNHFIFHNEFKRQKNKTVYHLTT